MNKKLIYMQIDVFLYNNHTNQFDSIMSTALLTNNSFIKTIGTAKSPFIQFYDILKFLASYNLISHLTFCIYYVFKSKLKQHK